MPTERQPVDLPEIARRLEQIMDDLRNWEIGEAPPVTLNITLLMLAGNVADLTRIVSEMAEKKP